eukprot:s699_g40.t1
MGPFQICGCPLREPRVFEIAHILISVSWKILISANRSILLDPMCMEPAAFEEVVLHCHCYITEDGVCCLLDLVSRAAAAHWQCRIQ